MASQRQIEANRLNAQRSTGPTTEEGKARSRLNAVTHGLTSELAILPLSATAPFIQRKQDWEDLFQPETPEARYALDRAVVASFRLEQCEDTFDALVVEQKTRARISWDLDGRVATARLADKLSKKPALIAAQLEETRHGCEWKIEMWTSLRQTLDANGAWTKDQASIALDLLGVAVALRSGQTVVDICDAVELIEHQRSITDREIRQLTTLNETTLIPLEDFQRNQAEQASLATLSAPAQRLHRYEREAWRRYNASMKIVKKREKSPAEIVDGAEVREITPDLPMTPAAKLDDDIQRQEAVVACFDEANRQIALTTTPEAREAVLVAMDKVIDRLKDRRIPFSETEMIRFANRQTDVEST